MALISKSLVCVILTSSSILVSGTAFAKSCNKIDKAYKEQFGRADFNEAIKPYSVGWFKKDQWPKAVKGFEQLLLDERLTPKAISTAYEEIAKIYERAEKYTEAKAALGQALQAGGFPEERNVYIRMKIDQLSYGNKFSDIIISTTMRTAGLNWPAKMKKSGHCKTSFNVSVDGIPTNIAVIYCTNDKLIKVAIQATQKRLHEPIDPQNLDALNYTIFSGASLKQFSDTCNKIEPE